jgi:hypothetical protein
VNKIKDRLGTNFVYWEKPLFDLHHAIKTAGSLGLVVSLTDTLAYIHNPANSQALLTMGLTPQALEVLEEAAASLSVPIQGPTQGT